MWKLLCFSTISVAFAASQQQTFLKIEKETGNILKNGSSFYQVGTSESSEYIFINASYKLTNWQSYPVINETNRPRWAFLDQSNRIRDPQIVLLKDKPRIFYAAKNLANNKLAISVAFNEFLSTPTSELKLWPTLSAPLLANDTQGVAEPSVTVDYNNSQAGVALFYTGVKDKVLYGVQLSYEGFYVRSYRGPVLQASDEWENGQVSKAHVVKQGDHYYLFYVGNSPCSMGTAIGVAKSQNVFGPYQKMAEPLITSQHFEDRSALCNAHPRDVIHKLPSWKAGTWPRVF